MGQGGLRHPDRSCLMTAAAASGAAATTCRARDVSPTHGRISGEILTAVLQNSNQTENQPHKKSVQKQAFRGGSSCCCCAAATAANSCLRLQALALLLLFCAKGNASACFTYQCTDCGTNTTTSYVVGLTESGHVRSEARQIRKTEKHLKVLSNPPVISEPLWLPPSRS